MSQGRTNVWVEKKQSQGKSGDVLFFIFRLVKQEPWPSRLAPGNCLYSSMLPCEEHISPFQIFVLNEEAGLILRSTSDYFKVHVSSDIPLSQGGSAQGQTAYSERAPGKVLLITEALRAKQDRVGWGSQLLDKIDSFALIVKPRNLALPSVFIYWLKVKKIKKQKNFFLAHIVPDEC